MTSTANSATHRKETPTPPSQCAYPKMSNPVVWKTRPPLSLTHHGKNDSRKRNIDRTQSMHFKPRRKRFSSPNSFLDMIQINKSTYRFPLWGIKKATPDSDVLNNNQAIRGKGFADPEELKNTSNAPAENSFVSLPLRCICTIFLTRQWASTIRSPPVEQYSLPLTKTYLIPPQTLIN